MSSSAKWCQHWISVRLWGVVQSDHRDSNSAFWQSNWPDIERAGRGGHFFVCVGNTKNRCMVHACTNPFWDTRNALPDFPQHLADAAWLLALLSIVPKSQSRENATQRQHGKNGFLLESFFLGFFTIVWADDDARLHCGIHEPDKVPKQVLPWAIFEVSGLCFLAHRFILRHGVFQSNGLRDGCDRHSQRMVGGKNCFLKCVSPTRQSQLSQTVKPRVFCIPKLRMHL